LFWLDCECIKKLNWNKVSLKESLFFYISFFFDSFLKYFRFRISVQHLEFLLKRNLIFFSLIRFQLNLIIKKSFLSSTLIQQQTENQNKNKNKINTQIFYLLWLNNNSNLYKNFKYNTFKSRIKIIRKICRKFETYFSFFSKHSKL